MELSIGIDIFIIKHKKTEVFYIFSIVLFNNALKKQIWYKMFVHGI